MNRRVFLERSGALTLSFYTPSLFANTDKKLSLIEKTIPSSGQKIAAIGMGTWITFNVGSDLSLRKEHTKVLKKFFEKGGQVVDSSPMYGSSQEVVGFGLKQLGFPKKLIAADKIWTEEKSEGPEQFQDMQKDWNIDQFGVLQVHNLVNWQAHLPFMRELKKQGKLRYIGVTTSHGRRHSELKKILKNEPLDFVQLTYNITHREVEKDILPLAQDKNIAVIANRPLDGGRLIDQFQSKKLPPWCSEYNITCWSQFFLKFIISHPALTCAIPATSQVAHMEENMGACYGPLPDQQTREKMTTYIASL